MQTETMTLPQLEAEMTKTARWVRILDANRARKAAGEERIKLDAMLDLWASAHH